MKLPRAIRLDETDIEVFERAAEPGEWCVPGAFEFLGDSEETLQGKRRQAFSAGFLGIGSFGFTTLVQIAEAHEDEVTAAIDRLARHLLEHHGAPHLAAALPAAAAEIDDASEACEHPVGTLLSMQREFRDDGIVERLRAHVPDASAHDGLKLWAVENET